MSGVIDVAVVGAGPAGLAVGDLGCEVTLIDAGSGPGGQLYRPGMLFPGGGPARRAAEHLDQDWRPVPGSRHEEMVDAVHVSFGFSPALELPRAGGCAEVPLPSRPVAAVACDADLAASVPGVFAAGEVTGAGGAVAAELEGYLAGTSARLRRRAVPHGRGATQRVLIRPYSSGRSSRLRWRAVVRGCRARPGPVPVPASCLPGRRAR